MRIHAGARQIAFAAALLCVPPAIAQTGAAPGDADAKRETATPQLEQIEVLGSHIRRVDIETQHPLLVLERADIERTGLTSISDVVQEIVANGETLNRNINNGAKGGEQQANLRSLGANRTLVLLNGQRFVTDIGGAVDLSAIPLALVERIEVLLDSASAIYGSDAIAGVINIILRRNFSGGDAGAYFGQTSHGDGARRAYDLSYGVTGERWSASAGVEYSKDDPIYSRDRAISSVPTVGLPPGATGSVFTPYTFLVTESGLDQFDVMRLISGRDGRSPADFRDVDFNADLYNYAPLTYLQTPQERRALFAQARYEFSPMLAFAADLLFNQRHSKQQLAPSDILLDSTNAGSNDAIAIAADNVYNPFGEPVAIALRRIVEAGPRRFAQSNDTNRLHFGLDGTATLAGRDLTWRVDASTTHSSQREDTGPYGDDSRLVLAVGPSFFDMAGTAQCGTPAAPIAGCVPLDLFGPPGSITPAMLDYVTANEVNRNRNDSRQIEAQVSGNDIAPLPGGGLGLAAGISYRRESGSAELDPLEVSGNANGNGITTGSTSGAYSVAEAYLEVDAPLLSERTFARSLELTVGTRYSHYSDFGGTTNSQLGLRWKPVDDLLVRANFAQGFRAPAITELFQGDIHFQDFGINDPCDPNNQPSATVAARCVALGVPADVNSAAQAGNVTQAGNPQLQPETSRSRGAGFVYTPEWAAGLDVSLDWYDIRVRHAIGDPGYQFVVFECYVLAVDAACAQVTRDPGNGTIAHVTDLIENLAGGIETEGYDLAAAWRRDTPAGRFGVRLAANYVDYFGEIGEPKAGTELASGAVAQGNVVGLNSPNLAVSALFGVIWRWRAQLQLTWERGPWSASVTGRYFSPIDEDCSVPVGTAFQTGDPSFARLCSNPDQTILISGNPVPKNRVASVTYTDIEADWEAPWRGRFTLGVRNALGRNPPVAYSAWEHSFFPDYDLPGRFFYVSYRQKF